MIKKEIGYNARTRNILGHLALGGIYKVASMILGLAIVPLTLQYLNKERYGVWAAVLNILSWITIFDIGIGNGLRNRLAEALAVGDKELARKYVSTSYAAISVISLVGIILMALFIPKISWPAILNANSLSNDELTGMMVISVTFVLINWTVSLCNQIFYAKQKASWTGLSQIISQIFTLVGLFVVSSLGLRSLIIFGLVYGTSLLLSNIVMSCIFFIRNPEISPTWYYIDRKKIRDVLSIGVKFFLMQISSLILFSTSNFIVMKICGPVTVASFSIVNKLFSIITTLFTIIMAPFWSGFTDAWTKKDLAWIKTILLTLLRIYFFLVAGTILLSILANPIMRLWVGPGNEATWTLITMNALYVCVSCFNMIFASFLNGIGLVNVSFILSIVQGVLYIPLSLFFVRRMGTPGALVAGSIALFLSSIIQPLQTIYILNGKSSIPLLNRLFLEKPRSRFS